MKLYSALSLLFLTTSTLVDAKKRSAKGSLKKAPTTAGRTLKKGKNNVDDNAFVCNNEVLRDQTIDVDIVVAPNAFCDITDDMTVKGDVILQEGSTVTVSRSLVEGKAIAENLDSGSISINRGTIGGIFVKQSTLAGVAVENDSFVLGDVVVTDKSTMSNLFRIESGSRVKGSLTMNDESVFNGGFFLEAIIDGIVDIEDSIIVGDLTVEASTVCTKGDNGFNILRNTITGNVVVSGLDVPGLVGEASYVFQSNKVTGNAVWTGVVVSKDLKVTENTVDGGLLQVQQITATDGKVEVKKNKLSDDTPPTFGSRRRNLRNGANTDGRKLISLTELGLFRVNAKEMKVEDNEVVGQGAASLRIASSALPNEIGDKLIVKKNLVDGQSSRMEIANSDIENLLLVQENVVKGAGNTNVDDTITLIDLNVPNLEMTANLADGGFTLGNPRTEI